MPIEIYPEMREDGSVWEIEYDPETGTYNEKLVQGGTGAGWDYPTSPSSEELAGAYGWEPTPPAYEIPNYQEPTLSTQTQPSVASYTGPRQEDSLPFKMDDGSFVFWKNGILFGPYNDQEQSQRAYNSANGLKNETTGKTGTTGSRAGSPSVSGISVDPALEYKKWAAEHALDVAREVYTMTKGDIDRARTAATGVISFYNEYANTFGFAPNLNMQDLYQSLYGPQVDWKQVFSDWNLDVGVPGTGASNGGTDTRPRSLDEARNELKAAGASAENLANDAWIRSEYKKLSGRDVI